MKVLEIRISVMKIKISLLEDFYPSQELVFIIVVSQRVFIFSLSDISLYFLTATGN